jgi:FtsH-binding integral membrane protein
VLILFGFIAAFFLYNSAVKLVYLGITTLIFLGYILVDTQLLIRHYYIEEEITATII